MGILGGGAGLVDVGLLRQVLGGVVVRDHRAHGLQSFVGDAGGVGSDVGDQTLTALAGDFHALVELLGDLHGLLGGEAQLAAGLLLEVRGGEGCGGELAALALLDDGHAERRVPAGVHHGLGLLLVVQLGLVAAEAGEASADLRLADGEGRGDGPVLLGHEDIDLLLAVADHLRGHRLHAACAQALLHLAPEQRADLVADQAIQHASGLLGVDQIHVDGAGALHRRLHGLGRDLVEFDAAGRGLVDAQDVRQMPGDCLTLAVRVSREVDLGGAAGLLADAVENLAATADGDVFRLEAVFHVYADLRLGHVAHVPLRGFDLVTPAQKFADGLGLCGRFDDNELVCHVFPPLWLNPARDFLRDPNLSGSKIRAVHAARHFYYYSPKFQHCQVGI